VHFAVFAQIGAIGVDDGGGIVVKPLRAFFKQGGDDDDTKFFCQRCQLVSGFARNGFCKLKGTIVFALAEVECGEELLRADDVCATAAASRMPLMARARFSSGSALARC
jgi:hypothetical protein